MPEPKRASPLDSLVARRAARNPTHDDTARTSPTTPTTAAPDPHSTFPPPTIRCLFFLALLFFLISPLPSLFPSPPPLPPLFRPARSYNKRQIDFNALKDYNDYLESVEDIIFNLCEGLEVRATVGGCS
jgi:hypothetical protein